MSQQGITIISLVSEEEVGEIDMGDIQFLSIKEFDGKLRSDEGFRSTAGNLASLTANTGKDMYIGRAKIVWYMDSGNQQAIGNECVLKINDSVIETSKNTMGFPNSFGGTPTMVYEFKNMGHKVLAGQIIKLEVITMDIRTEIEGFIECFEEDTGTTPQIPSI